MAGAPMEALTPMAWATAMMARVFPMVDAEAPCEVPIMFPSALPDVARGDRLWVRGRLACEPMPNRRDSLHFVQARCIDPVRRARGA
jgi:hypothetical protein